MQGCALCDADRFLQEKVQLASAKIVKMAVQPLSFGKALPNESV